MKLSEPADSKTDPGFENSPRFEGVTEQNKIQQTYDHDCIIFSVLNFLVFRTRIIINIKNISNYSDKTAGDSLAGAAHRHSKQRRGKMVS